MSAMTPLPPEDPRVIAWEKYRATEDYANTADAAAAIRGRR
jgi:hypothetical protein